MSNHHVPLVFEFCGVAGAGKTTVARAVLSKLNEAGMQCRTRSQITDAFWSDEYTSIQRAKHLFARDIRVSRLRYALIKYGLGYGASDCDRLKHLARMSAAWSWWLTVKLQEDATPWLLDEWLVHIICDPGIGLNKGYTAYGQELLKCVIDIPRLYLVYFEANPSTSAKRILQRPDTHYYPERLPYEEILDLFTTGVKRYGQSIDFLEGIKVPVLRVDGEDKTVTTAERITRWMLEQDETSLEGDP